MAWSIQARKRIHVSTPPAPNRPMRVEHEYERMGAWAYFAAWDVRRAKIHGRCEPKTGIAPFERLVEQVMSQEPYRSASRVFWIMDNGSSHRGVRCVERLKARWPNIIVVHTPVHASWLNQVEIYFSVLQRKALTPSDFASLRELEERIFGFGQRYEEVAKPFEWKFTRRDLRTLLEKLRIHERPLANQTGAKTPTQPVERLDSAARIAIGESAETSGISFRPTRRTTHSQIHSAGWAGLYIIGHARVRRRPVSKLDLDLAPADFAKAGTHVTSRSRIPPRAPGMMEDSSRATGSVWREAA